MPIKPRPFKLKCPKCGHSQIMRPTSDVFNPMEHIADCKKCHVVMQIVEFSLFDKLFKNIYR
jgi:transcription elongation factor Elf1